jgi:outer membrane protein assembly factor BamB
VYNTKIDKFDAHTGSLSWQYDTQNSTLNTAPTVAGNNVFISTGNTLYVINAQTGKERWEHQWGSSNISSLTVPFVQNNTIVVSATDGALHALDTTTGKELWTLHDAVNIISDTSSAINGVLYVQSLKDDTVLAVNLDDGVTLWQTSPVNQQGETEPVTNAIISGNSVYTSSYSNITGGGILSAFNAKNGQKLWDIPLETGEQFSNLQANNAITYFTANPMVSGKGYYEVAYDGKTGSQIWKFPLQEKIIANPVIDSNTFYCITGNGVVYALNAQNGKQRWSYLVHGDVNLITFNQNIFYIEVGSISANAHLTGDTQPPFTPQYIVALNENGTEYQRYTLPQNLSPDLLVAGNNILYLVGPSTKLDGIYHFFALKLSHGTQLWQQKMQTFILEKPLTTVIP